MQNEIISIIFENDDHSRVRLNPRYVSEIASALGRVIDSVLPAGPIDQMGQAEKLQADLYLVAADKGSLRLAFVAMVRGDGLSKIVDALTIWDYLKAAVAAMLASNAAIVADSAKRSGIDVEIIGSADTLKDGAVMSAVDQLIFVAAKAGSDKVRLEIPESPTLILSQNTSANADLVAINHSKFTAKNFESGNVMFVGTIRISSSTLPIKRNGKADYIYMASADLKGTTYNFAVIWNSAKPPPSFHSEITVTGDFANMWKHDVEMLTPVSREFKNADAVLVVTGVQSFE